MGGKKERKFLPISQVGLPFKYICIRNINSTVPQIFTQDFTGNQHGNIVSWSSSAPVLPQFMGYSAAHSYHNQQTHEWSQQAYKAILNSPRPGGIVTLNLGVYEPIVDPKGCLIHLYR